LQKHRPAKIREAETRKQKHDRRDARLLLKLLAEDRFPTIWMPSTEQRDLRVFLRHRHQWVRMRTRVQNTLQSMALANGLRRGTSLWSQAGQDALQALPLRNQNQRLTLFLAITQRDDRRVAAAAFRTGLRAFISKMFQTILAISTGIGLPPLKD
jgi:hypothetical protein